MQSLTRKQLTAAAVAIFALALWFGRTSAGPSASDFFQHRAAILAELQSRILQPPSGVQVVLPPTKHSPQEAISHAKESHILHVLKRQDWSGVNTFSLLLNLDETVLHAAEQGNSHTMTATKLMEHYFSGLTQHGLEKRGNGFTVGLAQMAAGSWASAGDLLVVEGTVFVAPQEKQAIVKGVIRERLPSR